MKSLERQDRLDALFTEYAIEHIDWPDSEEELDRFLSDTSATKSPTVDQNSGLLFAIEPDDHNEDGDPSLAPELPDIVARAYASVFGGHSIDRLIADPDRNALFVQACWKFGAQASQYELNSLLLNARKNKIIGKVEGVNRYSVPRCEMDRYLFASEFALRLLQDREYFENQRFVSLDRILCDPTLAQQFEEMARAIVPGFSSLDYRWAALSIRKGRNRQATQADLSAPRFERMGRRDSLRLGQIPEVPGFFWLDCEKADLYIGHAENLREQLERMLNLRWGAASELAAGMFGIADFRKAEFAIAAYPGVSPSNRESLNTQLVRVKEPKLNVLEKGRRVA